MKQVATIVAAERPSTGVTPRLSLGLQTLMTLLSAITSALTDALRHLADARHPTRVADVDEAGKM